MDYSCTEPIVPRLLTGTSVLDWPRSGPVVKTATEVRVRAIQDHKVMEWNTGWKCRLSEGTDDM